MRAARGIAAAFALVVLAITAWARAQSLELRWSAPVGCPDRDAVSAEVERLLGGPVRRDSPLEVRGTMVRRGDRLFLEIETRSREGEGARTLEGTTCEALAQAGALVIALAIDPEAVAATASGEPAPIEAPDAPAPEPAAPIDPPAPTEPAASGEEPRPSATPPVEAPAPLPDPTRAPRDPPRRERAWFMARALALLSVGPLPREAPGVGAGLGLRVGVFELWAEGVYLAEVAARVPEHATRGGSFGLALGRARGCAAFELAAPWLELAPCAAIEAGAMWGRGEGVPLARTGSAPWVSLSVGIEGRAWFLDALGVLLIAELQVPFLRPDFSLEIEGEPVVVHAASEVAGLFGLGLVLRVD